MARRNREKHRAALAARYEHDGVSEMNREQWGEWVDRLPLPEFMAVVDLSSEAQQAQREGLKPADLEDAQQLRAMREVMEGIRDVLTARRSVPKISLEVDPVWVRQNPGYTAKKINYLTDALMRTIAHCDAAEHKSNAYRDERDAIVGAFGPLDETAAPGEEAP